VNRADRRRLEAINRKQAKRRAKMKLTEEQQKILDCFNALDTEVKKLRVTVPTGAKVAKAFGALALAVDEAMQEVAGIDPHAKLEDKPHLDGSAGLQVVKEEDVDPEVLAAARAEPKTEPTVQ
jgi:hypothetical protein